MVFGMALLWIVATSTLILAAVQSARRLDPAGGPWLVIHTTIIVWSAITLTAVALSPTRSLAGPSLLLGVTVIALMLLAVTALASRSRTVESEGPGRTPEPRWALVAWGTLFAMWASHVAVAGLLKITDDFDSIMYHLPLLDHWLQAGSLYAPDGIHWSNPGAGEVIGLWAVAPFQGDFLAALSNLPAALLLAFGALGLGELIGLRPSLRHLTALALVANFVIVKQLVDTENDLAVAGLFVACSCYGLRFAQDGRSADLIFGAAALGLLCGIKYYALGYAAVAWAVALALSAWRRGPAAGLRLGATWALGAILLGGYWYLRNTLVSGSPFFPLGLAPETDVLNQEYPAPWRSSFLGNRRPEVWGLAAVALWRMTGPCHFAAILSLPVTGAWAIVTGLQAPGRTGVAGAGSERLALVALTVGAGCVLAVTPFALEDVPGSLNHLRWAYTPARYGLSFLSLAVLLMAVVFEDLATRARSASATTQPMRAILGFLPVIFLGESAVYQNHFLVDAHLREGFVTLLPFLELMLIFAVVWRLRSLKPRLRALAITILACPAAIAAAGGISLLSDTWHERFARHYEAMYGTQVFTSLATLGPERLALLDYRCHPFFGANRQNQLCQPRRVPSHEWLMTYLKEHGVTAIVVRTEEPRAPAGWDAYVGLGQWIAGQKRHFTLVHHDVTFSLFRLHTTRPIPLNPVSTTSSFPSRLQINGTERALTWSNLATARVVTTAPRFRAEE